MKINCIEKITIFPIFILEYLEKKPQFDFVNRNMVSLCIQFILIFNLIVKKIFSSSFVFSSK